MQNPSIAPKDGAHSVSNITHAQDIGVGQVDAQKEPNDEKVNGRSVYGIVKAFVVLAQNPKECK